MPPDPSLWSPAAVRGPAVSLDRIGRVDMEPVYFVHVGGADLGLSRLTSLLNSIRLLTDSFEDE